MRISDWRSDVCSSDLTRPPLLHQWPSVAKEAHPPRPEQPAFEALSTSCSLNSLFQMITRTNTGSSQGNLLAITILTQLKVLHANGRYDDTLASGLATRAGRQPTERDRVLQNAPLP